MTSWHRPPPDIDAAAFFSTWLPQAYEASGVRAAPDAPLVRISLSGERGGQWQVGLDDGALRVDQLDLAAARGAPTPDVWIRQSAADFIAAFGADPDLPALLPPSVSALDLLFLDPRDAALLRQISGRIAVEVTGRRRRRWSFDLSIGKAGLAAGRPRATVRLDAATYEGLANGTTAPLQALLQGAVQVEGDRALAMQAMLLIGSRLSR